MDKDSAFFLDKLLKGLANQNGTENSPEFRERMMAQLNQVIANVPRNMIDVPDSVFKDEVRRRVTQVFKYWERLHDILLRYEDVLRKRWLKKSLEQRKKVLLSAWPNMALTHRPEYQAFQSESEQKRRTSTRYRNEYLWPQINLEDLLKPKNLLLFLHSRGHHKPDVFARQDQKPHELAALTKAYEAYEPAGAFTVRLTGQTSAATYGKLVSYPLGEELDDILSGVGFPSGPGLLILEAQERILQFLVQCAETILHDLDLSAIHTAPIKPIVDTLPQTTTEWPSVAAADAEAPYQVPRQFDPSRLQYLINAKIAEAEDHLWSLREDPGYFQDIAQQFSENQYDNMVNENGKPELALGGTRDTDANVITRVVADAYPAVFMWKLALKELNNLARIRKRYGSRIAPGRVLPSDYEEAFAYLSNTIENVQAGTLAQVKVALYSSPALRSRFSIVPKPRSAIPAIKRRDPENRDYLLWLIETFCDPDLLPFFGPKDLLDEIERVTQSDSTKSQSRQNDRISPWVTKTISDAAVVVEVNHELSLHEPLPQWRQHIPREKVQTQFEKEMDDVMWFTGHLHELEHILTKAGTDRRFDYPSNDRRSAGTTQRMRQAEKELDAIWKIVDRHFLNELGTTIHKFLSIGERTVERTSEWVEPVRVSQVISTSADMAEEFTALDLEERTRVVEPATDATPSKTKIKTRRIGTEPTPTDKEDALPVADALITIAVSKRAQKVFSVLFYNSAESPPGEIPWTEFLHAMSSAGFSIERQMGSAWLFIPPSSLDLNRPIIFHEPHPSRDIPIQVARRHARRLRRAYGWTSDTFGVA
jgi:hypothetical protein